MLKYYIDIEFKGLKKAFKFIDDNEFIFDLMDAPFEHDIVLQSNQRDTYIVRCFIRPEDVVNLSDSRCY